MRVASYSTPSGATGPPVRPDRRDHPAPTLRPAPSRRGTHKSRLSQTGREPTRIVLAGAGGNGSQMVSCLARMDRALRSLGLPALHVTLYDPDRVSPANVGRQLFLPGDVGISKAVALVHRANIGFGLSWEAVPCAYTGEDGHAASVLITCVDTGAARRRIADALSLRAPLGQTPAYWLDIGNEDRTGQVWLGEFPSPDRVGAPRLPLVTESFPSFFDGTEPEADAPSCSLAEALRSQDLFVNDLVTRWGAHLLWTLLRAGEIDCRGYWVNLGTGMVVADPVPAGEGRAGEVTGADLAVAV